MPTQRTRTKAKKKFLEVLSSNEVHGSISKACQITGWSRQTIWDWRNEDITFNDAVDNAVITTREELADMAEDALRGKIKAGDTKAIIFTLRSLRKQYRESPGVPQDMPRVKPPPEGSVFTGEKLEAWNNMLLGVFSYEKNAPKIEGLTDEENSNLRSLLRKVHKRRKEKKEQEEAEKKRINGSYFENL